MVLHGERNGLVKRLLLLALLLCLPRVSHAGAYETYFATLNPINWWIFGDSSSPMADSGSFPQLSTCNLGAACIFGQPGIPGSSNTSIGSNGTQLSQAGNSTAYNPNDTCRAYWTILGWFKMTGHASTQCLMSGDNDGIDFGWELLETTGKDVTFGMWNSTLTGYYGRVDSSGGLMTDNNWHLVVFVSRVNTGTCANDHFDLYIDSSSHHFVSTTFTGSPRVACAGGGCRLYTFARGDSTEFNSGTTAHTAVLLSDFPPGAVDFLSGCGFTGSCTVGDTDWPYSVKAPRIPGFKNPGYEQKVVERGYLTGLYAQGVIRPRSFGPILGLADLPPGNLR